LELIAFFSSLFLADPSFDTEGSNGDRFLLLIYHSQVINQVPTNHPVVQDAEKVGRGGGEEEGWGIQGEIERSRRV